MDIVEELRDYINNVDDCHLRMKAADEIERLRFELEGVHSCGPTCTRDACVNRRLREKLNIAEKALVIACDNAREYEEYLVLDGEEALAAIRSE